MLTVLGASEAENQVYCYLATAVSATGAEIAGSTGLAAAVVHEALRGLTDRGLAARMPDSPNTPDRYVASSPATVEAMILDRLRELRAAQETLDQLAVRYRANRLSRSASGVFEVVHGHDALRQHSLQLLRSARVEALNLIKPPTIAVQSEERVRPSAGVRGRLIFETDALESPGALQAMQQELRDGDEIRVHTKLPIKMLAVDRSVALLPVVQHDTTPVGILVGASAVLDALLALFDYVWATAVPLHLANVNSPRPAAPSLLSDEDRHLLSLLLSGLTDEAIAGHQAVSVRTIQRRVHALMTVANVRTRMQLAWEAARRGWV